MRVMIAVLALVAGCADAGSLDKPLMPPDVDGTISSDTGPYDEELPSWPSGPGTPRVPDTDLPPTDTAVDVPDTDTGSPDTDAAFPWPEGWGADTDPWGWWTPPTVDTDDVPDDDTDTVPDDDTDTIPGGDTDTVPGSDTDTVPDDDTDTVPGGDTDTVPGGDTDTVPGGDTDAVPGSDTDAPDTSPDPSDTDFPGGDTSDTDGSSSGDTDAEPAPIGVWACRRAETVAGFLDRWQKPGDGKVIYCHRGALGHWVVVDSSISACIPHARNHRRDLFPTTLCDS